MEIVEPEPCTERLASAALTSLMEPENAIDELPVHCEELWVEGAVKPDVVVILTKPDEAYTYTTAGSEPETDTDVPLPLTRL